MNCLIVDDNKIARTTLKKLISLDPCLVLIDECSNATEAYIKILEHPIELLFLDIEMPGMTGMELAQSLGQKRPLIIFTTSNRDYAADAFDLDVIDFITKPVTTVRFLQAVEKAKEYHKTQILTPDHIGENFIFIRDSGTIRRLQMDNILYLEAQGDYVKIYVENQFYNIHSTLKSVEEKLPASVFLRVHRSFIINVSKIDTLEGGTLIINKSLVPVSDAYRAALNRRMQIL